MDISKLVMYFVKYKYDWFREHLPMTKLVRIMEVDLLVLAVNAVVQFFLLAAGYI